MKTVEIFMSALAAISMTALASCQKEDSTDPVEEVEFTSGTVLGGRYNDNITLRAGEYSLTSSLQIEAPGSLTIEPGTTITAAANDNIIYILIEQGAKINASGTATSPIVMTSEEQKAGAWGGLHICGNSHTNAGSGMSEIGNASYGGSDEADNSGTIEYVIIENSGYALDSEHEANGISLYGVGSGTKISNVYVVNGSDDGIEFFGGSVNIDHCLVENCTDDSFDWTEGWNGTAEYIVAYQSVDGCDCLMECDNNGDDASAEPVSDPVIRYATFVGMDATDKTVGIKVRAGTFVNMSYALVCGKTTPITLETPQTSGSFEDGDSSISHSVIAGELSNKENGSYDNAAFLAAGNSNRDDIASSLTDGFVGTIDGAGAVSASSDWTAWTR
ncbi:MAG: hypothetical protein IAB82_04640 [Bacteroidetes bacterium]|uniref:Lipoprotein n=1 Tax=Candidatus Cryptobacteroides faecavium TaxID=2840762 RepID=A0A9D9IF79_9BACT|nr:hypothetical protein [Candidatus Cryptobacteroides faecavium]